MTSSNYVHLDVEKVLRETEQAFLLLIDGEELWIPKSQISDPDDYEENDENCTMSITNWIATKLGLQ